MRARSEARVMKADAERACAVLVGRARAAGVPYELDAWLDPRGRAWVATHLDAILRRMWAACEQYYPSACEQMVARGHSRGHLWHVWHRLEQDHHWR